MMMPVLYINVREHRRGNQNLTIQRNWQDEEKQAKTQQLLEQFQNVKIAEKDQIDTLTHRG
jgi:hypothetical protein